MSEKQSGDQVTDSPERARVASSPGLRRILASGIGIAVVAAVLFALRPAGSARAPDPASREPAAAPQTAPPAGPMAMGLDALYGKRDPITAAARFREVLAQNPQHYGATYQLATALEQGGQPAEARLVWQRMLGMAEAIQDAPTTEKARARLAELDKLLGPKVEIDPDAEPMRLGLEALYGKRDPAGAAVLFRKVLAHNPEHYGATYQLATALDRANRPAEARPFWTKTLAMAEAIKDEATAAAARTRLAKGQ